MEVLWYPSGKEGIFITLGHTLLKNLLESLLWIINENIDGIDFFMIKLITEDKIKKIRVVLYSLEVMDVSLHNKTQKE